MATVSLLGSTNFTTTGGNATVTATPAVGDLIVAVVISTGLAGGATAFSDNNSDGLGSYTQIDADATGWGTTGVLNMYVRNSLVGSASSTVFTTTQVGSTGGGLALYKITGMSKAGSAAVRGSGTVSTGGGGTTPSPVLTQAALSSNPVIGAVATGGNPAAATPRSSPAYTEDFDTGYTAPNTGVEAMHIDSGETSATIAWGATLSGAYGAIAAEFDASSAAAPYTPTWPLLPRLTMMVPLKSPVWPFNPPVTVPAAQMFLQNVTATATTTASIQKQVNKAVSATATSTATIAKQVGKILSATVPSTASMVAMKVILLAMTATVTTTASIVKQVNKLLSATVATTASIAKQVNKVLSATVTTTATMAAIKVILRTLTATVTSTATIAVRVNKALTATATATASIVKRVNKTIQATVTSTATIQALRVFLRSLTATVTSTATMTRRVNKTLAVAVTATAVVLKQVPARLAATVTVTASILTELISPLAAVLGRLRSGERGQLGEEGKRGVFSRMLRGTISSSQRGNLRNK